MAPPSKRNACPRSRCLRKLMSTWAHHLEHGLALQWAHVHTCATTHTHTNMCRHKMLRAMACMCRLGHNKEAGREHLMVKAHHTYEPPECNRNQSWHKCSNHPSEGGNGQQKVSVSALPQGICEEKRHLLSEPCQPSTTSTTTHVADLASRRVRKALWV